MPEIIEAIKDELVDHGFEGKYEFNFAQVHDDVHQYHFSIFDTVLKVHIVSGGYIPAWWYEWTSTLVANIDLNHPDMLTQFLDDLIWNRSITSKNCVCSNTRPSSPAN